MSLRALKTWHWVLIGLVAGALVGVTRVLWALQAPVGGRGYITQLQFEEAVHALPVGEHPYVMSVAIHPYPASDQITLVSINVFDADANRYREYLFAAPRDFKPIGGNANAKTTTVDTYLAQLAAANPALMPRYAWWDASWATIGFFTAIGGIFIGGAWPLLLRVTGGPEPKETEYDLDRFSHESPAPQAAMTSVDETNLRELDDAMTASLVEGSGGSGVALGSNAPAPVRELENQPLSTPTAAEQTLKDYSGEYYPVEKPSPHGFSLVELVVVIGIIMLLIAFAMPAVQYAQKSAATVKCAAQLRSVGQALHAYANDNHGSLPAWSGSQGWHAWPPNADGATSGPAWTVELIPYIGKPDSPIYNCPSFPRPGKWRNYFLESQWSGRSGRSSMKLSDVTMTSRFVLSGDTSNLEHFPDDPTGDDCDPDDFGGDMLAWPSAGGVFMHLGGNNVLFDDGHVLLYGQFSSTEMTFNPHRMERHDEVTPD